MHYTIQETYRLMEPTYFCTSCKVCKLLARKWLFAFRNANTHEWQGLFAYGRARAPRGGEAKKIVGAEGV